MSLLLMRASPFRQIISTPGLVALYLPWMDVYGRNVSQYLTQPSLFANLTRSDATYMETSATGAHVCNIDRTGNSSMTYQYRVKITPIGRKRFLLGHGQLTTWAIFDTSLVSVIAQGAGVFDARITSNGDGTYNLSIGILQGYSYPGLYTMPDNATTADNRSFAGDTGKGFIMHEWQVNLGSTLYPYSAPVEYSQSVVDQSGLGNAVQRGSTSAEDTNDPLWSPVSLYFDGVDDVVSNEPSASYILYAWGATNTVFGWATEIPATAGYWFGGIRMSRTPGASEEARLKANIATILAGQGVSVA
jgi:hypothetical protein